LRRTMAETEPKKTRSQRTPKPRTGAFTFFKVNKIPWELYDRINGKAGFLGLGRDEWIREVMERETAEGIPLQKKWTREHNASKSATSGTDAKSDTRTDKKDTSLMR
jgi:hypothetical protein